MSEPHFLRFWFSLQSMIANDEGEARFEDGTWRPDRYSYGEWLPPRTRGYNIRDLNDSHGAWYLFDQRRTPPVTIQPRAPGPAQVTHYKTFSFYVNNQRIWIYRCNALRYGVGDERQEPPPRPDSDSSSDGGSSSEEDERSDELEDEMSDELEDWRELSFNHHTHGLDGLASFATVRAQSDVLCAQRPDQTWPAEVLPLRYHLAPEFHTTNPSHGGLLAEIPTKIALVAFSVTPDRVQTVLTNNFHNTYVSSGQLGGGWIDKRGLVVRVYCQRGADPTLRMFEKNELGYGPYFA